MTDILTATQGLSRQLKLELALSSLTMFCHLLIKGGQLPHNEKRELNALLRNIEKVLHEETQS